MPRPSFLAALVALTLAACGGGRDASADSASATAAADSAPSAAPAAAPAAAAAADQPLAVEDIDRWAKGLDAEIAAVDSGAQRLKAARTGADTLAALAALQGTETAQTAATAVGVSVERYRTIAESLGEAARATLPPESELPPDVLTPQMREEYKKGQEAALARVAPMVPAPVLDALRPRAAELRKKELQLVGSRLKAASGR